MKVLCSAPFNSLTINPNKSVNPCCAWDYKSPVGNLNQQSIQDIRSSPLMKEVKQHMLDGVWHPSCRHCKHREKETNTSVRLNVYNKIPYDETEKILYLEYSSTNTCNLACSMCDADWSSTWVDLLNKHGWNNEGKYKIEPINRDIAQNLLDNIDLSNLMTLWLKGGEPFLNKENILVLEKLKDIDQLQNVNIMVTTNCTVINEPILQLLEMANQVTFVCSIDAVGNLNEWIRFAPNTQFKSDTDTITKTLKRFSSLKNLNHLTLSCAVSVFNVFNLHELRLWWENEIVPLFEHKLKELGPKKVRFVHFVVGPENQSARVLTQQSLNNLIDYYTNLHNNHNHHYTNVIEYLKKGYLGNEIHNSWVTRTDVLNKLRPYRIEDIVPQLTNELIII
jgi:radical SAM protein with 4Fe4S-binding SPASM domain